MKWNSQQKDIQNFLTWYIQISYKNLFFNHKWLCFYLNKLLLYKPEKPTEPKEINWPSDKKWHLFVLLPFKVKLKIQHRKQQEETL